MEHYGTRYKKTTKITQNIKNVGKSVRLENKSIDKFGFFYIQQLEKMQRFSPINFSTSIISICDNYIFP